MADLPQESLVAALADAVPALLGYWDIDMRCRFVNETCLNWFGKSHAAVIGSTLRELLGETVFALNEPYVVAALAGKKQQFERTIRKADGTPLHALTNYTPRLNECGEVDGFFVLVSDITELKEAQRKIALAATVFDSTIQGILVTDRDGLILTIDRAFTQITGYSAEEVVGRRDQLFQTEDDDAAACQAAHQQVVVNGHWQREAWGLRKDGTSFLASLTRTLVQGQPDEPARYVTTFSDNTELWRRAERIRHLAFHDVLTDLPNRSFLLDYLDGLIRKVEPENRGVVVMFLDLDRFKLVNDTFGHDMGDAVLAVVAERLRTVVRQSDVVARLGGDEFVIVLDRQCGRREVGQIANRIIANLNEPIEWNGMTARIGTSIGVAEFPTDGLRSIDLLGSADKAMYASKQNGRNGYQFMSGVAAARSAG